jgi:hypothetical protein
MGLDRAVIDDLDTYRDKEPGRASYSFSMDPALTTTPCASQTSIRGGTGRTRVPAV